MSELYHHGVKGMKWGVRKDRVKASIQKKKKAYKKKQRKKNMSSARRLYKHRDEYSVEEINRAMEKFQMEKRIRDMARDEINYGYRYVNGAMAVSNAMNSTIQNTGKTVKNINKAAQVARTIKKK